MMRVICRPCDFEVIFTVLLQPFTMPIGRSFQEVHYLKGGETAQQNSLALLHFYVTGQTQTTEEEIPCHGSTFGGHSPSCLCSRWS